MSGLMEYNFVVTEAPAGSVSEHAAAGWRVHTLTYLGLHGGTGGYLRRKYAILFERRPTADDLEREHREGRL